MTTVSIVITTYKRPALLVEAVQSCLQQTYPPYEILIGDDSPDEVSKTAIENLTKDTTVTIRYFHNQPSLGQAKNVNSLFDAVEGEKMVLLHDDDLLLPEALEVMVNVFDQNPKVRIAFGKQYVINGEGEIEYENSENYNTSYYRHKPYEGTVLSPFEAGLAQQIPNNGYMIDSAIVKEIKWKTDLGNGCEYEFGYRLGVEGYLMYFIDAYLCKYRVAGNSMSTSRFDDAGYQAFKIIRQAPARTIRAQKIKQERLYQRAPIAITQAIYTDKRKEAAEIYFSRWYRHRILSLRGLKRMLLLLQVLN